MKERPILFSGPMVRAILDGRKTQTRRVVKPLASAGALSATDIGSDDECWWIEAGEDLGAPFRCPYGSPGGRLWVRETCRAEELSRPPQTRAATRREREAYGRTTVVELNELDGLDGVRYAADDAWLKIENSREAADRWFDLLHYGKKPATKGRGALVPAIHMPRWASRITLEITSVRVERLNDCSESDAMAEGASRLAIDDDGRFYEHPNGTHQCGYAGLWDHINGAGSWAANPWVWVVEFQRLAPATAAAA